MQRFIAKLIQPKWPSSLLNYGPSQEQSQFHLLVLMVCLARKLIFSLNSFYEKKGFSGTFWAMRRYVQKSLEAEE